MGVRRKKRRTPGVVGVLGLIVLGACGPAVRSPEMRLTEGIRIGNSGATAAAVMPGPEIVYRVDLHTAAAITSRRDAALGVRDPRVATATSEWPVDARPSLYDLRRFPNSRSFDNSYLFVAPRDSYRGPRGRRDPRHWGTYQNAY